MAQLPLPMRKHLLILLSLCAAAAPHLSATPVTFQYDGDSIPSVGVYADWFTTVGPGHPTGSYFIGTSWSSDGDVLTMTTRHPSDGGGSLGIWFGRTSGYGDPSNFNLASTAEGNRVDVRLALAADSSEWSLYWYDTDGYGASLYLQNNGFTYWTAAGATFVPRGDMTSFHTYSTHVQDGKVGYYFDGVLLTQGTAGTGLANFLLLGDGSATDITGYGSLRVDGMSVTVAAGVITPGTTPAGVPEGGSTLACLLTAVTVGVLVQRGRRAKR